MIHIAEELKSFISVMTHSISLSAFLFLAWIVSPSRRAGLSLFLSKGLVAVTNEEEAWIQTAGPLFLSLKAF